MLTVSVADRSKIATVFLCRLDRHELQTGHINVQFSVDLKYRHDTAWRSMHLVNTRIRCSSHYLDRSLATVGLLSIFCCLPSLSTVTRATRSRCVSLVGRFSSTTARDTAPAASASNAIVVCFDAAAQPEVIIRYSKTDEEKRLTCNFVIACDGARLSVRRLVSEYNSIKLEAAVLPALLVLKVRLTSTINGNTFTWQLSLLLEGLGSDTALLEGQIPAWKLSLRKAGDPVHIRI